MNNNTKKMLLLVLTIIYVISPVDLMPGPIDDVIVVLLQTVLQKRLNERNYNVY